MKMIAIISGFLLIGLAAVFGFNFTPNKLSLGMTAMTISVFVGATSLVLGVIFGKPLVNSTSVAGCIALILMWLPLQIYSTWQSLTIGFCFLILTNFILFALGLVGARVNATFLPRRRNF